MPKSEMMHEVRTRQQRPEFCSEKQGKRNGRAALNVLCWDNVHVLGGRTTRRQLPADGFV